MYCYEIRNKACLNCKVIHLNAGGYWKKVRDYSQPSTSIPTKIIINSIST